VLLRRHTTPLFSASLRSVAVETPPTPPVIQVAALGGRGPGWSGQLALEVHCPLVMLHLPIGGHSVASVAPGVLHMPLAQSHTAAVMLHMPVMFGQSLSLLHTAWLAPQELMFEQQNWVWPWLQAVAKQAGGGT